MHLTLSILVLLALALECCSGVQFDIQRKTEKCLRDELVRKSLAVVQYGVLVQENTGLTGVSIIARDPRGKYLKEEKNIPANMNDFGSFQFTADIDGAYEICFYNNHESVRRVFLEFKHGVEARDYTEVAKKEHLAPVEKELRQMEDTVDEIHREMLYMRKREAAMRDTNESTNSRVLWFSIISIVILLIMGGWQIYYLKNFFKSKKLI